MVEVRVPEVQAPVVMGDVKINVVAVVLLIVNLCAKEFRFPTSLQLVVVPVVKESVIQVVEEHVTENAKPEIKIDSVKMKWN